MGTFIDASNVIVDCGLGNLELGGEENFSKQFEMTGITPESLKAHAQQKDYIMVGVTIEEFIKKHGNDEFNLSHLQNRFSNFCPDYKRPLDMEHKSLALEFA